MQERRSPRERPRERASGLPNGPERAPKTDQTVVASGLIGERCVPSPARAFDHQVPVTLQRLAGNLATGEWIRQSWRPLVARQPAQAPANDIDQYIGKGDWSRAAQALVQVDETSMAARVRALSSAQRQYLVEGARHVQANALIAVVDGIDHRDAVIGSVRFYVWKHLWLEAGTFLCGLNDPDIRRVATQLALNFDDLRAIADAQADEAQVVRLYKAFFSEPKFAGSIPKDLVGKEADRLVIAWLATDKTVAPYAAAKWSTGKLNVHIVPAAKWADLRVERSRGRIDPELGRERTPAEARQGAVTTEGFTDLETGDIYLRQGDNTPGRLIHEAIHALAPEGFRDALGEAVNEGATEYFARRVAASAGKHPSREYPSQHAGVEALASLVGDSLLAEAFFTGKTLKLQFAIDDKLGEGTFKAWRDAMADDGRRKAAPDLLKSRGNPRSP